MILMRPNTPQALVLFSPAIVLTIWAAVIAADDGYVSTTEASIFLAVLAIAVASAEFERIKLRSKSLKKRQERNGSRDDD